MNKVQLINGQNIWEELLIVGEFSSREYKLSGFMINVKTRKPFKFYFSLNVL